MRYKDMKYKEKEIQNNFLKLTICLFLVSLSYVFPPMEILA